MKVRVAYTVEVDDHFRRGIRSYYGETGLATRREVAAWFERFGDSMTEDDIGNTASDAGGRDAWED